MGEINLDDELKIYLEDLAPLLGELEGFILELVNTVNNTVNFASIRRLTHSIKGSASSLGFDLIATVCHKLEDYLALCNDKSVGIKDHIDILFTFKDDLALARTAYFKQNKKELNRLRKKYNLEEVGILKTEVKNTSAKLDSKTRKAQILVIESSKTLVKLISNALNDFAVETSIVRDGYEALGRLLRESFDLIIMGGQTTTINALGLIKTLEAIPSPNSKVKFVVLSYDEKDKFASNHFEVCHIIKGVNLHTDIHKIATTIASQKTTNTNEVFAKFPENFKILLIDDSVVIHKLLDLAFKDYGQVKIEHCYRGLEAEKMATEVLPDLVLLDIQMPDVSGDTVYMILKNNAKLKNTSLAFITATTQDSELEGLSMMNPLAILRKPFSPKQLPYDIFEAFFGKNSQRISEEKAS